MIRSNMLTALANKGHVALIEVERLVQEFLSDPVGDWLPDDFLAPHELLERSILECDEAGRTVIIDSVHRILTGLLSRFSARSLSETESRILFGALIVAVNHPLPKIRSSAYLDLLYLAVREPDVFWGKVQATKCILGDTDEEIKSFATELWNSIPDNIKNNYLDKRDFGALEFGAGLLSMIRDGPFKYRLNSGEIVKIYAYVNGRPFNTGMLRTPSSRNVFFPLSYLSSIERIASFVASKNIGKWTLRNENSETISNAISTRLSAY